MSADLLERPVETKTAGATRTITVIDRPERSITWRTDRPEDVARARALFAELSGRGYFAYVETVNRFDGGTTAEVVRDFREDTDLRFMPVMVGG